jgi:hypothetical protein
MVGSWLGYLYTVREKIDIRGRGSRGAGRARKLEGVRRHTRFPHDNSSEENVG